MAEPTGWLATVSYEPPASHDDVILDVVTPTRNRPAEVIAQAARIGQQLGDYDRWIVVDDASDGGGVDSRQLVTRLPTVGHLMLLSLTYARGGKNHFVNRARHAGCSLARPDAWIVEIDDHDLISDDCLALVRDAICRGAVFVYGDCQPAVIKAGKVQAGEVYQKPNYRPYLLRDEMSPCEGVRAFPRWLYDAVGGYRWYGPLGVNGNEFPAGDYGLFTRMELRCEGQGFYRIPKVLCQSLKVVDGISTMLVSQQADMARAIRRAAKGDKLL